MRQCQPECGRMSVIICHHGKCDFTQNNRSLTVTQNLSGFRNELSYFNLRFGYRFFLKVIWKGPIPTMSLLKVAKEKISISKTYARIKK